jgi:Arc/MetJ-type ribon-helix-helix transcriptional regulator
VSDRKIRVTVTLEPHLAAYAERLVEAGKAPSVSAVVNDALTERVERDRRIARRWKELTAQAELTAITRGDYGIMTSRCTSSRSPTPMRRRVASGPGR